MARHGTAGQTGALFEGRVPGDRRDRRKHGGLGSVAVLNTTPSRGPLSRSGKPHFQLG